MTGTPTRSNVMWGLSLRSRVIIALVAALIVSAKFFFRVPLHVPGHSGFFWMALLLIGVAIVGKPPAGTLIGLISGVLATFVISGSQGMFVGIKYLVPGIVVDLLFVLLGGALDRYPVAMVVGAAANASKLAAAYLFGLVAGAPAGYLALGLGAASVSHIVFGALGGLIAAYVINRLGKAGIAPVRAAPDEATP